MPRKNTKPADYPQAVIKQIGLLAQNIVIARKRRKETQAQWAGKLGVSQPTMARIERGDPSVAMASYVMCMWLINQASGLPELISPLHDHASLEREITRIRTRLSPSTPSAPASSSRREAGTASKLPAVSRGVATSTNHANTAAGLAALLPKADHRSK
jgi:DNA-binding XRE family transcriptional regulator